MEGPRLAHIAQPTRHRGHAEGAPVRPPVAPEPLVRLLGRRVRVRFVFGGEAVGTLEELAKYEFVLRIDNGERLVVFKGSVQTVEEVRS